jgi:hypothetical protein
VDPFYYFSGFLEHKSPAQPSPSHQVLSPVEIWQQRRWFTSRNHTKTLAGPSLSPSSLGLPFLAATTGRAAAPFVTSSPGPSPATSTRQVCPPLLFPSAVRNGAPETLTKLFVFGSVPVAIYYLLSSILFAKIIGCACVHPCPMLGPRLPSSVLRTSMCCLL